METVLTAEECERLKRLNKVLSTKPPVRIWPVVGFLWLGLLLLGVGINVPVEGGLLEATAMCLPMMVVAIIAYHRAISQNRRKKCAEEYRRLASDPATASAVARLRRAVSDSDRMRDEHEAKLALATTEYDNLRFDYGALLATPNNTAALWDPKLLQLLTDQVPK